MAGCCNRYTRIRASLGRGAQHRKVKVRLNQRRRLEERIRRRGYALSVQVTAGRRRPNAMKRATCRGVRVWKG
jgi:hypothetical protein